MTERRITGGTIRVEERDGLVRARGIPYGTAARFAVGEPAVWSGVRDATRPGPACPQRPSRLAWVTGAVLDGLTTSEDCLVLSVTAPAEARDLPVMVWFHGGAYVSGSGESQKYDPTLLVREGNVVVVNVTYRVGIFGYLGPVGDDNLGLRDQILALRWVRDNITEFGGDPGNVTAFGQSAGGHSVMSLMLCEPDLFHRAIVQSAPLEMDEGRDEMAQAMQSALAQELAGIDPVQASVDQLLSAEAAAVQAAQPFGFLAGLAFAPRLGRAPLPPADEVAERIAHAASRIELLAGWTKDDGAPFVVIAPEATAEALTKFAFADPTRRFVEAWSAHGGRAATYRFDWTPEQAPLGSCHCMELPFLFGSTQAWSDASMLGPNRIIDERLAVEMRTCWAQFARQGVESLPAGSLRFG
ncbi:carboxylesterase family protein [Mycolicibacterium wolinskyi]|uniref:Para-nitrobenzyl esterase n=1 Tax=Mycolicibacterium wolinskyi TaxID=59750 RepID=A0A1X2FHH0_9MYCO|nr:MULTISPECIES: carboxylesterase family protein [Mycolicibacterium]MCV7285288.1 carboxylesterase family protein [Mycolicibacterium wolinskyi]MCV7295209.1 carboxylesterase family protein [Mycolicibacterium goodii]ORX17768.1 para-nitrobenzyl esterase [Mycolicibacterium wolinskyi]